MVLNLKISKFFVAHSISLYPKDVALEALPKIREYIDRRNNKDREIERIAEILTLSLEQDKDN